MGKANEKTFAQQFLDVFESLCYSRSNWQVWSDFILMSACSISNATDKSMFEQREEMYMRSSKCYTRDELDKIAHLFALTTLALEENPDQDFLGDLYNILKLYNNRKGQFFTPYNVAKMMAQIQSGNLAQQIDEKGYISVNDCCCGAGALLIAFANAAREQGVNYQRDIIFVAQDIDFIVAMMAYIQLALLGYSGYVIVGNSLDIEPPLPESIWYMLMGTYFGTCWRK